jgi:uncharacterized membrane protein YdjX (TVP38/TMEM64 family)
VRFDTSLDRRAVRVIKRRVVPIGVLLIAVALFYLFGLDDYLTCEALQANRTIVTDFVDAHRALALILYVFVYAVIVTLSVPGGALMTVTGGFLFGVVPTTFAVVIGATAGATALFLIAKTALGDPLRARAAPWLKALEAGFQEHAFPYLLVLRLFPLFPFFVVNLVPAFLGVSVATYVGATFVGIIPGVVIFSLVGDGLGSITDACGTFSVADVMTPKLITAFVGVGVLLLAPIAYKKIKALRRG